MLNLYRLAQIGLFIFALTFPMTLYPEHFFTPMALVFGSFWAMVRLGRMKRDRKATGGASRYVHNVNRAEAAKRGLA